MLMSFTSRFQPSRSNIWHQLCIGQSMTWDRSMIAMESSPQTPELPPIQRWKVADWNSQEPADFRLHWQPRNGNQQLRQWNLWAAGSVPTVPLIQTLAKAPHILYYFSSNIQGKFNILLPLKFPLLNIYFYIYFCNHLIFDLFSFWISFVLFLVAA